MARTLTATIASLLRAVLTSASGKTVTNAGDTATQQVALTSGTGDNQVSQVWESTGRTLAISGSETLTLVGSLVNDQGETVTLTAVKAIRILNKGAAKLEIGKAASHPWEAWCSANSSAYVPAMAGTTPGKLEIIAPLAGGLVVGSGSADQLKIVNTSGSVGATYDILVMGNS